MKSSYPAFALALLAVAAVACSDPSATFEAACSDRSDCALGFVCLHLDGDPQREGRCVPSNLVGDAMLPDTSDAPDTSDTSTPRPDSSFPIDTSPRPPDTVTPPPDTSGPRDMVPRPDTSTPPDTFCPERGEPCGGGCPGVPDELCACGQGQLECLGGGPPECIGFDGQRVRFPFELSEQCDNGIDDNCDGRIDENCMMPGQCELDGQPCDPSVGSSPDWVCVDLQADGSGTCRRRCVFDGCEANEQCVTFSDIPGEGGYCAATCEIGNPGTPCAPELDGRPRYCQLGELFGPGIQDFCVAANGPVLQPGDSCSDAGLAEFEFCRDNGLCLFYTGNEAECFELCSANHAPVGSSPHPDCSQPGATCTDAFGVMEFGLCAL